MSTPESALREYMWYFETKHYTLREKEYTNPEQRSELAGRCQRIVVDYKGKNEKYSMSDIRASVDKSLETLFASLDEADKFTLTMTNKTPADIAGWGTV